MASLARMQGLKSAIKNPTRVARAVRELALLGWPEIYCAFGPGGIGDSILCGAVLLEFLRRGSDPRVWLEGLQTFTRRWVEQHRNGIRDHWTVVRSHPPQENALEAQG
jgi:hypothetical protein